MHSLPKISNSVQSSSTWRMSFPSVETPHLLLCSTGIRGPLPLLLQSFLENRSFRVRIGNYLSTSHPQDNGNPQESPLSGTLFLIAINKCANIIPPPHRSEPSSSQMISALTSLPATPNGPKESYS